MTFLVKSPLAKDGGICSILFLSECIFQQQEMGPSPRYWAMPGRPHTHSHPSEHLQGELQIPSGFSSLGLKKKKTLLLLEEGGGIWAGASQAPQGCGWQPGDDYEPPLSGDRRGWTHLNINHFCKHLGKSRVAGAGQGP